MKCAICEKEFYGVGYKTHNEKTLCVMCTKDVVDTHHYKFIGRYQEMLAK
jgi:hypothetical protein